MTNPVKSALISRADLFHRVAGPIADDVYRAGLVMIDTLRSGGKILIFGNGGSAADAQHFASEIVGRFHFERDAAAAIALTTDAPLLTSIANDYGFDKVFSRQIEALVRPGDVAVAISTSGRSPNVIAGALAAVAGGGRVITFTGQSSTGEFRPEQPPALSQIAEVSIEVPEADTALVQEVHAVVIHILCQMIDEALAAEAR